MTEKASREPNNPGLLTTVASIWTLLFGIGLLMVANGLQGSLLGVRAEIEAFDPTAIGLIMAGFFVGMLAGSRWTPMAVRIVGHVRVFAAMAAVASATILIHAIYVQEVAWWIIRFATGFCYAGILVVAESWLNECSPKETRGQVLALYFAVTFAGLGCGQLLLNLASVQATDLFILVSVLISLAVVPLLLRSTPIPRAERSRPVSIRRLASASPLGFAGVFVAGLINGTILGMGAVYARMAGFTISETASFMALLIVGAAVMQWPIGKISDLVDRRKIIALVTIIASLVCLLVANVSSIDGLYSMLGIALMGGFSLSLHSLSLAYTNDYLETDEMVGASSGLVLVMGVGSVLGPMAVGVAIGLLGPSGFFIWLFICHVALGLFAFWRMRQREPIPNEQQSSFVPAPVQGAEIVTAIALELSEESDLSPDGRPPTA